ncbi:hypothetical protein GE253_05070 [Niveispirillum sp. SYP-B3756]|uniref:hypothetical protein n=1 Tax=Niveispirillum sp. SYP-B3756 TaxID=2662178 RepID=UPI001291A231|nr:hypothetical protein [Niveispirillum sp. SYP-B3756]MQP64714.1 hypothetical protein [Niveispirillum sp. SYP-B3756]
MKQYVLMADKRGYGAAGETIALSDTQAQFLLLTQAVAPVRTEPPDMPPASADPGGAGPPEPAPDAETGTDGTGRRRRLP